MPPVSCSQTTITYCCYTSLNIAQSASEELLIDGTVSPNIQSLPLSRCLKFGTLRPLGVGEVFPSSFSSPSILTTVTAERS